MVNVVTEGHLMGHLGWALEERAGSHEKGPRAEKHEGHCRPTEQQVPSKRPVKADSEAGGEEGRCEGLASQLQSWVLS